MIERIGDKRQLVEGDFVEVCGISELLYLFSHGELIRLTPQEYDYLHGGVYERKDYGYLLMMFRRQGGV